MADIERGPGEIKLSSTSDIHSYVGFAVTADKPTRVIVMLGGLTDDGEPVAEAVALLSVQQAQSCISSFRRMIKEAKDGG